MAKRKPENLVCDICSERMDVVRVIASVGALPELKTFRCSGCECFLTLEPDEIEARANTAQQTDVRDEQPAARELSG